MRHWLTVLLTLLLAACSMRQALNVVTSEEDRAFALEVTEKLREGDASWLQERFSGDLWAMSGTELARAPSLFPRIRGETEIVSAEISSQISAGMTARERAFTLVTSGEGEWTVTRFRTFSDGGPERIVQWRVTRHRSPPPELLLYHGFDRTMRWLAIAGPALLLAAIALIFWLLRRSRRDPLMGSRGS
jgi:hypothetical protein